MGSLVKYSMGVGGGIMGKGSGCEKKTAKFIGNIDYIKFDIGNKIWKNKVENASLIR